MKETVKFKIGEAGAVNVDGTFLNCRLWVGLEGVPVLFEIHANSGSFNPNSKNWKNQENKNKIFVTSYFSIMAPNHVDGKLEKVGSGTHHVFQRDNYNIKTVVEIIEYLTGFKLEGEHVVSPFDEHDIVNEFHATEIVDDKLKDRLIKCMKKCYPKYPKY